MRQTDSLRFARWTVLEAPFVIGADCKRCAACGEPLNTGNEDRGVRRDLSQSQRAAAYADADSYYHLRPECLLEGARRVDVQLGQVESRLAKLERLIREYVDISEADTRRLHETVFGRRGER